MVSCSCSASGFRRPRYPTISRPWTVVGDNRGGHFSATKRLPSETGTTPTLSSPTQSQSTFGIANSKVRCHARLPSSCAQPAAAIGTQAAPPAGVRNPCRASAAAQSRRFAKSVSFACVTNASPMNCCGSSFEKRQPARSALRCDRGHQLLTGDCRICASTLCETQMNR
jgi:hypothetical protein